jgi:hypothetical protein
MNTTLSNGTDMLASSVIMDSRLRGNDEVTIERVS